MSTSQLLSQPSDESRPELATLTHQLSELSIATPRSEILLTALSALHVRFSSNTSFTFGKLQGDQFSTCSLTIEPSCSVRALNALVEKHRFEDSADVPEHCGVVFSESDSTPETFLQRHLSEIEVFYRFDRKLQNVFIHYRKDLFDARTAELWASAFQRIVTQMVQSQSNSDLLEVAIGKLEIVDESVSQQMVANGYADAPHTSKFYSNEATTEFTFHRQFEMQVQRAPDRVAVWARKHSEDADGETLSYAELNRQANSVARFLIDSGITPEDSVGIVMQRRVNLLAALIGVMKAGGRYVALEAELPTDRLAFMANDSTIKYLITEESLAKRTADLLKEVSNSASVTTLVCGSAEFAGFCNSINDLDANPDAGVTSQNAAYTIYTSGSTGTPKGVEICHHAFVNFCNVFVSQLEFTDDDTSVAMSTIAFDASIGELFPLLLIGGRVAIGHKQVGADGKQLQRLISDVDGTYMAATPTSLRVLVASGWEGSPNLTVIPGGEALTPLVRDEVMPRVKRLINGYGPTECTVYSTFGFLENDVAPIALGGPILNARLYVLDEFGQPVPPMVRGNLFIGGQSVARGYLNRPELTAEKFVPDPFVDQVLHPNARMYNSGDVVYWDHDHTLFYVGRSDHQVKLRGYRIELGEIEARLKQHPRVQDAVAMVREDAPGDQRLVAYVISSQTVSDVELQDHLLKDMPEYMVPTWFVSLDQFPTNHNQKLDRNALPLPESTIAESVESIEADAPAADSSNFERASLATAIAGIWSKILNRPIKSHDQVFRMGADSLRVVKFQVMLSEQLGRDISVAEVFQYPTADKLARQLLSGDDTRRKRVGSDKPTSHDIAVIGMAGRFPAAPNIDVFWDNLINEVETIRDFTEEELIEAGVSPAKFGKPNYVPRGSVLEGIWEFEPEFFGITRADAEILSPQLRLFLKTAWEAMEHGGYPVEPEEARFGVFAGGGMPNYLAPWRHVPEPQRLQRLIGNGADFLSTRASYALGLTGPSVAVQTACSTSLVAVVQACHAIRSGQCEFALAGGSSFSWPHAQGYEHGEGLIYSADGHCRAFDSRASGTIFSHGAGVVLLRPLSDAIADGDTVHAVIRGVGLNNDGDRKGGYAAPSIEGQSEVIQLALEDGNVSPRDISYVEAHGTGTIIGDPIEVAGLTRAWKPYTQDHQFCAIGSVKTNIGHADAAAGIAGLLKVILSLKHEKLPANLNFDDPNPAINFQNSPFFVQEKSGDWRTDCDSKIAAISAFGMGGTNAHVIVAQGQTVAHTKPDASIETKEACQPQRLLPFSARTDQSLDDLLASWTDQPHNDHANSRFSDVAFTLQQGRKHFGRRAFTICDSEDALQTALKSESPANTDQPQIFRSKVTASPRKAVFMFSGQGSQYPQMGRELYQDEPVFAEVLDQCDQLLTSIYSEGLVSWLFSDSPQHDINQTQFAQIALFCVAYAQAKLWQSWGVEPDALLGHSIGEYVAVALAEVMSLEDVIRVVAHRGRLMQSMAGGCMLAVMHGETAIESLIESETDLDLAVVNSSEVAVVAGAEAVIEAFALKLKSQGIQSTKLRTSHGFHSAMMEPMLDEFENIVEQVPLRSPRIPYLSNVTGTWITDQEVMDPNYYARQVRSTVRFAENLTALAEQLQDDMLLIEIGPGHTLTQIARKHFAGSNHAVVSTIPHPKEKDQDASRFARVALGRAWAAGLELDWSKIEPQSDRPRRIPLPIYRFNEQTYRVPQETIGGGAATLGSETTWFNVPIWKQARLDEHRQDRFEAETFEGKQATDTGVWLALISDPDVSSAQVANWIGVKAHDGAIAVVAHGSEYSSEGSNRFVIRANEPSDYARLVEELMTAHGGIAGAIHGWTLFDKESESSTPSPETFWRENEIASISVAWLARALGDIAFERPVPLTVMTRLCANIDPEAPVAPAHRAIAGGCAVVQKEHPAIVTKVLSISQPAELKALSKSDDFNRLLQSDMHEPLLVRAAGQWWRQTYEQVELHQDTQRFKSGGVYVFTGGLGGLARNMAIQLAKQYDDLKIGLVVRNDLPPESSWQDLLSQTDSSVAETQQRVRDVLELQSLCTVQTFVADVSKRDEVLKALQEVESTFGTVGGLLHTAGILRDGAIATKSIDDLRDVYAAKALSATACCDVVRSHFPDLGFVALFSSIASDIGLFGQYDYSAANGWLDGLATTMNQAGVKTTSINWPAIRGVGMAARTSQAVSESTPLIEELAENSFSIADGTLALIQIVNNDDHQRVVLSQTPFSQRQKFYINDGRETRLRSPAECNSDIFHAGDDPSDVMLNIWRLQFNNEDLTLDDNYFDLGGDSLMAIGMTIQLEEAFGRLIPISHLIGSPTPRKLIQKMGLANDDSTAVKDTSKSSVDWIIPLKESTSSDPPLILIHGADGSVLFYREFANRLKTDRTIFGIESPFLQDADHSMPETVQELATAYVEQIVKLQTSSEFLLAGYSFGGVIAFEIAYQLQQRGLTAKMTLVYDAPNPALLEHTSALERLKTFWNRQESASAISKSMQLTKRIGQAVQDRATVELENRLSNRLANDSETGGFWRHKKCREHHMAVEEAYKPKKISAPLSIVIAKDNSSKFKTDESLGWSSLASKLIRFEVPGSHLELFEDPYLANMVTATEQALLQSTKEGQLDGVSKHPSNDSREESADCRTTVDQR